MSSPPPTAPTKRRRESSGRRRADRQRTTYLLQFPPAQRPPHITPTTDEHRLALSEFCARTLAPIVEAWEPPHHPHEARRRLTAWTHDVGCQIEASSRKSVIAPALGAVWPLMILEVNRWMLGHWSTRASLAELLWRLEVSPHAIAAADWLWTIGDRETSA